MSGTDLNFSFSKSASIFFSSFVSSKYFMLFSLFDDIFFSGFSTWNDGFKKYFFLILDEWDQISVVINIDYIYFLVWIPFFVGVLQNS